MFISKKNKIVNLIDFSMQDVSTGQVEMLIKYLCATQGNGFKYINIRFGKNTLGDTRCYLTTEKERTRIIQYFKDRNPSQIEELAKSFS
jgi:hypothetical protein